MLYLLGSVDYNLLSECLNMWSVLQGGALSCDSWRRRMDDLMIEVATNACKGGWTHFEKHFHCMDTRVNWEDFQLVALRALLASILSPAGYRPPYLSKGLSLFLKGNYYRNVSCSFILV